MRQWRMSGTSPRWGLVRQRITHPVPVLGPCEGSFWAEGYGHVVVGVFDPPDAGAGDEVESEVFPGAPEGIDPGESFRVLPPTRSPAE